MADAQSAPDRRRTSLIAVGRMTPTPNSAPSSSTSLAAKLRTRYHAVSPRNMNTTVVFVSVVNNGSRAIPDSRSVPFIKLCQLSTSARAYAVGWIRPDTHAQNLSGDEEQVTYEADLTMTHEELDGPPDRTHSRDSADGHPLRRRRSHPAVPFLRPAAARANNPSRLTPPLSTESGGWGSAGQVTFRYRGY